MVNEICVNSELREKKRLMIEKRIKNAKARIEMKREV
jgi:hypothetical protein